MTQYRFNIARRRFLSRSVRFSCYAGVVPLFLGCAPQEQEKVDRTAEGNLGDEARRVLTQMVRDLFPGPGIDASQYASVVDYLDSLAADDSTSTSVITGTKSLEEAGYLTGTEIERIARLRSMEATPFFQMIRFHAQGALYGNPSVGELYGYEGESFSKGGYLNRGFDDIDWLEDQQ